jgi:hypothetical protein
MYDFDAAGALCLQTQWLVGRPRGVDRVVAKADPHAPIRMPELDTPAVLTAGSGDVER